MCDFLYSFFLVLKKMFRSKEKKDISMIDWGKVKHFIKDEMIIYKGQQISAWGDPDKMKPGIIYKVDKLRAYIKKPIVHTCPAWSDTEHSDKSTHSKGEAIDCTAIGMNLIDFYFAAERFHFGGIGLYDGNFLHLDDRSIENRPESRWE